MRAVTFDGETSDRRRRAVSGNVSAPIALLDLAIVKLSDQADGFKVTPKRWLVERTFAWLARNRRLVHLDIRANRRTPLPNTIQRRENYLGTPRHDKVRLRRLSKTENMCPDEPPHFWIENIIVAVDNFICVDHQHFFRCL